MDRSTIAAFPPTCRFPVWDELRWRCWEGEATEFEVQ
jgi:hypothetical protein